MIIRSPGEGGRRPGLALVCVAMFAACSLYFHNFFSAGNLAAIAQSSALVLICAMGATALLVSGNLDVSIGSMFAVVSVGVALVDTATGSGALAAVSGVVLGAVLGAGNGILVELLGIPSLIVTLATLALYRGLAYLIAGGQSVNGLTAGLTEFAQSNVLGVPAVVMVALLTFGLCTWMLSASVSGLRLFAIGGDRDVSRRLGLRVRRLVVQAFAFNGALVGLAAVLGTAVLASGSPTAGVGFEMDVLTAVILGGVAFTGGHGHPVGVLLGVATIGVLDAALIFAGLAQSSQQIARGAALLIALTADQLVRRRRRRRAPFTDRPDLVPASPETVVGAAPSGCTVSVRDLSVRFPGVEALADVSLELTGGEIVCVVGDNGAGKSALVGVLSGVVTPSRGQVVLGGAALAGDPYRVRKAGVETVFQKPAICPNLSGVDNLVLGLEPRRRIAGVLPVRDVGAARRLAARGAVALGLRTRDLERPAAMLSGGEQQSLAVMRVIRSDARLVLLDEPTASIGMQRGSAVLQLVRDLARSGRAVLYVTHDVEEVFEIADRVVVLQRGRLIHDSPLHALTRLELLALMSGRNRKEANRTLKAVDEERFKIERNLHDGAQQELLHAALMVGVAADRLDDTVDPRLVELLRSSKQTIRQALGQLRNLSRGVYPAILASGGLAASLPSLAERSAVPVELDIDVPRLAEDVELVAHFVLAEALTNVQKHAAASFVRVRASYHDGGLALDVTDDGCGGADESRGTGLAGMRARLRALDGWLTIVSDPGAGTSLRIRIPAAPLAVSITTTTSGLE